MRIAQIVTYVSADGAFGGPVAVAIAQSQQLAARGHEVHFFAGRDADQSVFDIDGVVVHLGKHITYATRTLRCGLRVDAVVDILERASRKLAKSPYALSSRP